MPEEHNPYTVSPAVLAVEPALETEQELAGRWVRLAAQIIDGFIGMAIWLPVMWLTGYFDRAMKGEVNFVEVTLYGVGGLVVYLLIHGYTLHTKGQSLGKMACGVRIVHYQTGTLVGLPKIFGQRLLPLQLISMVPYLGGVVGLVNSLMIFRTDRRCAHDLIAGTKVVRVGAPSSGVVV